MKASSPEPRAFTVVFESVDELEAEYFENLSSGGIRVESDKTLPPFTADKLTLRIGEGRETSLTATVVAQLPGALALSFEGKPAEVRQRLLDGLAAPEPAAPEKDVNLWDRLRALSHVEKMMLAQKADRTERAVLIQDNDPQVLLYLLKNPRIGVEEVVRIAKSPFLAFATAELILKTPQFFANPDVKTALIHNARLPVPMALRILPLLPESEVRLIAKGNAVNQTLKQAALKLLIKS